MGSSGAGFGGEVMVTIRATMVAGVVLVLSVITYSVVRSWASVVTTPDGELIRMESDTDVAQFELYTSAVEGMLSLTGTENGLNRDRMTTLGLASAFFERFVDRTNGLSAPPVMTATAYRELGHINLLQRNFRESEAAYRTSLSLCREVTNKSQPVRVLIAVDYLSLSWLLAMTGRLERADQAAASAAEACDRLLIETPDDFDLLTYYALALRNQGIIREAMASGDPLPILQKSIDLIVRASEIAGADLSAAEFLADTQQIFAQIQLRHSLTTEAARACQQTIELLEELLADLAERQRDGEATISTRRFRDAIGLVHHNLMLLDLGSGTHQNVESGSVAPTSNWNWKPLKHVLGSTIPIDLLVNGQATGEFEPQDAFLLSWHECCRQELHEIVVALDEIVPLIVLVPDRATQQEFMQELRDEGATLSRVSYLEIPTNTAWVRDYGPLAVRSPSGSPLWIDSDYVNAFTRSHFDDDDVPSQIAKQLGIQTVSTCVLLEGGALINNGSGLCLVSSYLLERNQELGLSEEHLTNTIKRLLGANQVVYLEPLDGEETGHVDWFATFPASDTVVVGNYGVGGDPYNRELLNSHARTLARLSTSSGPLKVVRMPMPPHGGPKFFGGSYTNVVYANGVLLVPLWSEASPALEASVFATYRKLLPGWRIIGINANQMGQYQGALHCATMNLLLPPPRDS